MITQNLISLDNLNNLIEDNKVYQMELTINGEYYNINNNRLNKFLLNAFNTGYNKTITLKINGEVAVLNGVALK